MQGRRSHSIDRIHQHIVWELEQGARTDTVFVLIAVLLSLLMLGISSGIAEGRPPRERNDDGICCSQPR